jgi:hypothetical protein
MGIFEIIMLIAGLAAGVFGGQVIGKRQGIKQERVSRRMKDAEATNKAMKDVNHADADSPADADAARKRLSDWHSKQ